MRLSYCIVAVVMVMSSLAHAPVKAIKMTSSSADQRLFVRHWKSGHEVVDEIPITHNPPPAIPFMPSTTSFNITYTPDKIFPPDGRFKVTPTTLYPFSAVVKVQYKNENGSLFECTGWMIGPRTVATAAHCIYDDANSAYFKGYVVTPAVDSSSTITQPYGSCGVKDKSDLYVPASYPLIITDDFGVILLNCNIGVKTGWFGFRSSNPSDNTKIVVPGYQGDKPNDEMWASFGDKKGVSSLLSLLYHDADTFGGSSGAPVWTSSDPSYALAINVRDPVFTSWNEATLISDRVHSFLYSYKNAALVYLPIIQR